MTISFLEELRQNFRIADAIDIAVIAVLLYSALVWFRQTASRRVLIGVSVVAGLYFLALALDMHLTSLVFHTAFAVLLVILVVVFQEEIRRVFERVADFGTLRQRRLACTLTAEAASSAQVPLATTVLQSSSAIASRDSVHIFPFPRTKRNSAAAARDIVPHSVCPNARMP